MLLCSRLTAGLVTRTCQLGLMVLKKGSEQQQQQCMSQMVLFGSVGWSLWDEFCGEIKEGDQCGLFSNGTC